MSKVRDAMAEMSEALETAAEWARQVAARKDVPQGIRSAGARLHDDFTRLLAAREALQEPAIETEPVLIEAVKLARDTFEEYANLHFAKVTADGNRKAEANARLVEKMNAALSTVAGRKPPLTVRSDADEATSERPPHPPSATEAEPVDERAEFEPTDILARMVALAPFTSFLGAYANEWQDLIARASLPRAQTQESP